MVVILRVVAIAIISALASGPAVAEWFTRLDDGNKLVVSGVAVDPDGVLSGLYLTCHGNAFSIAVLTHFTSTQDELESYAGSKVIIASRTKEGDPIGFGADGTPKMFPGDVLAIEAGLSSEQSGLLYHFLARGQRVDIELVHPELGADRGTKKVFAIGANTAALAINAKCPKVQ